MQYWLIKSEPDVYGWDDLVRDKGTFWNGVRNNTAALNLKKMAVGDLCLYYHSNEGKACVGIAKVTRTAYPDPTDESGRWVVVDVAPVEPLRRPVTLAEAKAEPRLKDMVLVNNSRMSVQPVSAAEWAVVQEMARTPLSAE